MPPLLPWQKEERQHGRKRLDPRPTIVEIGPESNYIASAKVGYGMTQVLAEVGKPKTDSRRGYYDSGYIRVIVDWNVALRKDETRRKEAVIEALLRPLLQSVCDLESIPLQTIVVNIIVLSTDGDILTACINAAVAALLHAGISLRYTPIAVALGFSSQARQALSRENDDVMDPSGCIFVDPTDEETREYQLETITFVTQIGSSKPVAIFPTSSISGGDGTDDITESPYFNELLADTADKYTEALKSALEKGPLAQILHFAEANNF